MHRAVKICGVSRGPTAAWGPGQWPVVKTALLYCVGCGVKLDSVQSKALKFLMICSKAFNDHTIVWTVLVYDLSYDYCVLTLSYDNSKKNFIVKMIIKYFVKWAPGANVNVRLKLMANEINGKWSYSFQIIRQAVPKANSYITDWSLDIASISSK